MSWIEIGFWVLTSILTTIIASAIHGSDVYRDGYERGYIDGSYKVPKNPFV